MEDEADVRPNPTLDGRGGVTTRSKKQYRHQMIDILDAGNEEARQEPKDDEEDVQESEDDVLEEWWHVYRGEEGQNNVAGRYKLSQE